MARGIRNTPAAFYRSLTPVGECLEYSGVRTRTGYGRISYQRKWWSTHRLAWTFANGPIPDGLWVLHKCDNPPCCNPAHLYLGTHADNERDVMERGRSKLRGSSGTANGRARLTPEQVEYIRSSHLSERVLAREFDIARSQIGRIRRGERWTLAA